MPAIGDDFDKRRNRRGQVRRRNRRRSSQRSAGRSPPLEIIVIETLPMLVFGERVDG